MLFKKNFRNNGRWESVVLYDNGIKQVEERLRKDNIKLFEKCKEDAGNFSNDERIVINIATALFEKLADKKFTRINATLEEMVEKERQ